MAVTAAFAIGGIRPLAPLAGRRFGQFIIGAAISLNLTPVILATLVWWLPATVAMALLAMLVGAFLAKGLARHGRLDQRTAYFAMMPGGLSEMATIGASHGARSEPIALIQAMRVSLVVCILPPLIVTFGLDGGFATLDRAPALAPLPLLALAVAAFLGIQLARLLRLNNPWMIGALIGAAALTASGWLDGRMPRGLFYFGQFLLGIAIGARFQRRIVIGLLPLVLTGIGFILAMAAILFVLAVGLAWCGGIDIASATLATSPGGFAEMVVTAEMLHLNVALVTLFHVTRAFMVNSLSGHLLRLLVRLGFTPLNGPPDP